MVMSETSAVGLPEAARRLGVSVRVLRQAIRGGKVPSPGPLSAERGVSPAWVADAKAAIEATPGVVSRALLQKVSPFARYEGTSAWRKYRHRVRAYYRHLADQKAKAQG